ITGSFQNTADFDPGAGTYNLVSAGNGDIFIAKYTPSGALIWAKRIGNTGGEEGNSIAIDGSGNIYITGYFWGTVDFDPSAAVVNLISNGLNDIFVAKYDNNGNYLWAFNIGSGNGDIGNSITVETNGNCYITGYFYGTADFDPSAATANLTPAAWEDVFIAKYTTGGNYVWAEKIGGSGTEQGFGITYYSPTADIYLTGYFQNTADFDPSAATFNLTSFGSDDIFVAKYSDSGNLIWAKQMGGGSGDNGFSLTVDGSGNVYSTGYFGGTSDFDPGAGTFNLTFTSPTVSHVFVSKLDASGNFVWAKQIGGSSYASGSSIGLDNNNNVYTTGYFRDTADFDPGPGIYNLISPSGISNTFISKLDNSGAFIWAKQFIGSGSNATGTSLVLDGNNNLYVTGYFEGTTDFNPGAGIANLVSNGGYDIFFAKYAPCNLNISTSKTDATCFGSCNGSITANVVSGGIAPFNYLWSNSTTSNPVAGLCAGITLVVTVTDNNSCTATANATITEPAYTATYTDTVAKILFDERNCQQYPIVKIGNQWWMTENLNAGTMINSTGGGQLQSDNGIIEKYCYNGTSANCNTYGGLYEWGEAMGYAASENGNPGTTQGVCPTGWRLPTDAEWCEMENFIDPTTDPGCNTTSWRGTDVGAKLKDNVAWNGNNASGFSALPAGYRDYSDGSFYVLGSDASFWSTTEYIGTNGWYRTLAAGNAQSGRGSVYKTFGFSVRCLQDVVPPLTISVSSTNVTCNGGSDGTATATPTGGTPPYTYSWSNSATTSSITGLIEGTYVVTVAGADNDTATAIVTIIEPTDLTVSPSAIAASCNGVCDGAITATASGGILPYTYFGTGTNLCAGFHSIQVTDANGCTATSSATITEPAYTATYTDTVAKILFDERNCRQYPIEKIGSQWWMTENLNYGTYVPVASGGQAGAGTQKYCQDLSGFNDPSCPLGGLYEWDEMMNGAASCNGTGAPPNDSCPTPVQGVCPAGWHIPSHYEWTTLEKNVGIDPGSFPYDMTTTGYFGTDEGGNLKQTGTTNWTTPNTGATNTSGFTALPGGNSWAGSFSSAGLYGYWWSSTEYSGTYAWYRMLSYNNAQVYRISNPKAYGFSCLCVKDIVLFAPLTISVSSTNVNCNGGSDGTATATVTGGTSPYAYNWSNSATTSSVTGLIAGSYAVTVIDAGSDTATAIITITEPAAPVVVTTVTDVTCNSSCNGSITAAISSGTSPFTYLWSTGATGNPVAGLCAGTYAVTVTDANGCTASSSAIITQPSAMSITFSASDNLCYGYCYGSITATVAGGASPFTYLWSNGATGNPAANLCAGSYLVTITDANNCTATASAIVTEPAAIAVSISATDVTCNGSCNGSAAATVSGGTSPYNYSWSNGSSTSANAGLCAGTYTVTVVDAAMCGGTPYSATITEPAQLLISNISTTNVSCYGECDGSALATGTVSGGVSPYTLTWSTGSTGFSISNLCAGNYTVTVTDANNCTATASAIITGPPAITITNTVTDAICYGSCDGSAAATVSGGTSPINYTWSNGASASAATGLCAGTYTVTVIDAAMCGTVSTATITEPAALTVVTTVTDATCNGYTTGTATATATGGTTPYSYTWNPGAQTNQTATGLAAGTYIITVTDANSCTATATAIVNEPTAISASIPDGYVSCNGACNGSSTVTANGGVTPYTYLWSDVNSQTTVTATGLCANSYSITITDANNCNFVWITSVSQPAVLTSAVTATDATCPGCTDGSATVIASGGTSPYSYLWSNGATNSIAAALGSGSYTVTVTDVNGCTVTAQSVVSEPACGMSLSVTSTNISCYGAGDGSATVTASGGTIPYSYLWSNGDTSVGSGQLAVGNYTVTVTDSSGCTATAMAIITEPSVLAITISQSNVSCYGQCDGVATISATGGTPPYSFLWSTGSTDNPYSNLCNGLYTATITDANGCIVIDTVIITQPLLLSLTLTVNNVSCFGQCNGSATAGVTGGTTPYTYSWSAGGTGSVRSNLCIGSYFVTVTDANGCQAAAPFNITAPNQLNVSVLPPSVNLDCYGECTGTTQALASGGVSPYLYAWSNGETNFAVGNLCAGTFTVTVTDANNCTGTNSVNIMQPSQIVITTTSVTDATCGNADGSATITVNGGTPPYKYNWSNNDTLPTANNLPAGSNSVIVMDANKCVVYGTVLVDNSNAPYVAASTVTDVTCSGGNDGAIAIIVTGGMTPWTYNWSDGETSEDRTGLKAGIYNLELWGSDSCVSTASFTVNEPYPIKIVATVTDAGCLNSDGSASVTVSGGALPYFYLWNTNATTSNISNLNAGIYSVAVTDANGCSKVFQVIVGNSGGPEISVVATSITCDNPTGGIIDLTVSSGTGTPPYTYNWSNSDTTEDLTGLTQGTYSVTVTDASGCIGFASAEIKGELLGSEPICIVTVDSISGKNLIVWDKSIVPGAASFNIYKEGVSAGVYNLLANVQYSAISEYVDMAANPQQRSFRYRISAVDSCGNESELSGIHKTMYLGVNIGLNNKINLLWDAYEGFSYGTFVIYRSSAPDPLNLLVMDSIPSNLNYWTDLNPPNNALLYYVVAAVKPPPYCNAQVKMIKTYNSSKSNTASLQSPIGIQELKVENLKFKVYPNPNSGEFTIELKYPVSGFQYPVFRIINIFGQEVFRSAINNPISEISLTGLEDGIYTMRLESDGNLVGVQRIVLVK
ncbi:MAG: SBBP repeat-containing protein, partial [Bacteroidetes bacterium]|nr:SBBP repeat-containing protein [Bacteroidota bacterium]